MRLRTRYTQRLPTAPGLRLDIPMFEGSGTKVLDVSGKGNHGTITDAVWTRDENGVAMSFNGTSAYINCGNDASLNITDAITIEAWIKPTVNASVQSGNIVIKENVSANSGYAFAFGKQTNKDNQFFLNWDPGTARVLWSTDEAVTVGVWNHLVGVHNGTHSILYVNGVQDGIKSNIGTITPNDENLIIGNNWFSGTIDEVRIYAVALTAEQIKRRYEQTKRDYVRAS